MSYHEALERNEVSRLPGGIFNRAFVRSYAAEVGLDPERSVREFVEAFPEERHAESASAGPSVEPEPPTFARSLQVAVVIVGIVGLLIYARASRRSEAPNPEPPRHASPSRTVEEPPRTAPAPAPAPSVGAGELPPVGTTATRLTVELSATRVCWVSATVDGQKTIQRLLQPGEERTVDVGREMVLIAGDAAALRLTLNGAPAKPLGKPGEVVTARVNLSNFHEFLSAQ
jgi:cytoskeletal protein RodZ